jgi:DNA-binding FadR family transcriptional regulator
MSTSNIAKIISDFERDEIETLRITNERMERSARFRRIQEESRRLDEQFYRQIAQARANDFLNLFLRKFKRK